MEQREDANLKTQEIEKSIRKKFHKQLFSRFAKAVRDYRLVQEGDRIAVCISGGKDSMLMAKLFQEIQRHRKVSFELEFLVMDPGYLPRKMRRKWEFPLLYLRQIFSARYMRLKNRHAISAHGCAGGIYTIRQKR